MIADDTGLKPQILQPVARPTDTYAAPAAGEQLAQLASALTDMSPGLSRLAGVLAERGQAQATQAGQNKARDLVESGKTYAQAIKEGLISEHESPWFRLGAYETFGRVSANKYADDFRIALAQSPVSESTNPKDFDTFESQFRGQWSKQNLGDSQNPYFRNSFGSQADAQIDNERNTFSVQAGNRLVGQAGDAFHAELVQTVKQGIANGQDASTISKSVNLAMSRQAAAGMAWKRINDLATSAVTQTAKLLRNTDVLNVLDNIDVGANAKLGGTAGAMSAREEAQEHIATVNNQEFMRDAKQQKVRFNAEESSIVTEASQRLAQAPDKSNVNLDDLIGQMTQLDRRMVVAGVDMQAGSRVQELFKLKDAFVNYGTQDNPDISRHLAIAINTLAPGDPNYVTNKEVSQAFGDRQLSLKTYREMVDDITKRDKEGGAGHFMNDDGIKLVDQNIKGLLGAGIDENGFWKPEYGVRGIRAQAEAMDAYLTWRKQNPAASHNDVVKEAYAVAQRAADFRQDPIKKTLPDAKSTELAPPRFGTDPAPIPVDYNKQLVTDRKNLHNLFSEWTQLRSGIRNALSPASQEILKTNNIPLPDPKSTQYEAEQKKADAFIQAQIKLLSRP